MGKRGIWAAAAGMVLAGALIVAWQLAGRGATTPSIVLILVDTLRADHLGCYGYFRDTSPQIDAFARDALLFEKAMTPIGATLPSHVSLFSSTNPPRHGIRGNFAHFHVPVPTGGNFRLMAQILSARGYRTAAFVSSPALSQETGVSAGFEVYGDSATDPDKHVAEETTDRALKWLEQADDRHPFFLFVHYVDPHSPYSAPEPFAHMFKSDATLRDYLTQRGANPQPPVLAANNGYDGEVRYTDTHVGRLLDALRRKGLYDRAAVVFTADHGEGLGQHGWLYHGRIYNEQMLVPLIVRLPARSDQRGARFGEPVSLIDVLPTLMENLGLPPSPEEKAQFEGIDVFGNQGREYVFADRTGRQTQDPDRDSYYALAGLRWKFFLRPHGGDRLFDIANDPAELRNVIAEQPEVAKTLRALLTAELESYEKAGFGLEPQAHIPESAKDQLRRLGYEE